MQQAAGDIGGDTFLLVKPLVLFAVLFAKPLGGWLSDKVGRRRWMISLQLALMALIYPAMHFMIGGGFQNFAMGQVFMAIPLGMALGLQGAMVVEIFPLRTRVMSMSVAYSVTLALAGGTAPMVADWLV